MATARLGLDPDDQSVPVITSCMDLAGVAACWGDVVARCAARLSSLFDPGPRAILRPPPPARRRRRLDRPFPMATPRSTRLVPRRARRVYDTLRAEQRTLQQGVAALALSTAAGFVAGLILGSIAGTLELMPGLLVLIPASVGMRGMIFGAMGARLGTGIAAGVFEPTLRRGGLLSQNVEVAVISAVLSSFYLAGMAKLVASAFGEDTVSFWDLVTISVDRRSARLGGDPGGHRATVDPVVPARMGPRRGLDPHGHGDRRHDHAAGAVPCHLHRAERLPECDRRGHCARSRRSEHWPGPSAELLRGAAHRCWRWRG